MNIDTLLLAEISQNIKALQLQLDYEREKIITALGGEPALYNVSGTGALTATTAKVGTGSAIAGVTVQVDGDIVIGDGAGGEKIRVTYASVPNIGTTPVTLRSVSSNLELWLIQFVGVYATSNQHGIFLVAGGSTASVYRIAGQASLVLGVPTGWQIGLTVSGSNIQATEGPSWTTNPTTAKLTIIRSVW
jgi:hypothetical protein